MDKDSRRKVFIYEARPHLTLMDSSYRKYCRMANAILPLSTRRCGHCPLLTAECREIACKYFDLSGDVEISSEDEERRTQGMIALGLSGEFPEFVDGKEWPKAAMIYEKALQFAANAHKGAFRKGTRIPYIVHPVEVSMIVLGVLDERPGDLVYQDFEVAAAAALHDVVEDTDSTLDDIWAAFNERIESLVAHESEDKRDGLPPKETWRIRKEEFLDSLANAPIEAKLIALGDKLSNLRSIDEDLRNLGPSLWERFNQKDPKLHQWYYQSVGSLLSCFSGSRYYQEYLDLLEKVFGERLPDRIAYK